DAHGCVWCDSLVVILSLPPSVSSVSLSVKSRTSGIRNASASGCNAPAPCQIESKYMNQFSELPISSYMRARLAAAQFSTPTPVQQAAIPAALDGKDLFATAQTGTGKTLAFLAPVMEQLIRHPGKGVSVLILVPTRELAMQVAEQYDALRGPQ